MFNHGDIITEKSYLFNYQHLYKVVRVSENALFVQIRRVTKLGKYDKRYGAYSHTALVTNFQRVATSAEANQAMSKNLALV